MSERRTGEHGTDLNPDEGADALETPEEAERSKRGREDQDDDDIITLDTPD